MYSVYQQKKKKNEIDLAASFPVSFYFYFYPLTLKKLLKKSYQGKPKINMTLIPVTQLISHMPSLREKSKSATQSGFPSELLLL